MTWRKIAIALALGTAGLTASSLASAQADPRGWYVGGSLGQMEAKGDCPSGDSCDFKDTAWKVFGGYRINRHFAAEAFYGDFGEITSTRGAISARAELKSFGLTALGILPVGQAFELFGKAGLGRTEQKASASAPGITLTDRDKGSEFIFGFGAAYNFTRSLGVRAEWERLSDSEVDVLSIGLQYKF